MTETILTPPAQTTDTWVLPADYFQLLQEAHHDSLGCSFDHPTKPSQRIAFAWHVRTPKFGCIIITHDHNDGRTIYKLRSTCERQCDDLQARYELWEVEPPSSWHNRRLHPQDHLFVPERSLTAKDMRKVQELIMLLPATRADWWRQWGRAKGKELAKLQREEPLTTRLADEMFVQIPTEQHATLDERKQRGRLMAMAQVLGLR